MPDFDGFKWREMLAIAGVFLTAIGFILTVLIPEMRDLRARIRALERTDAQQWCVINPGECRIYAPEKRQF